MKRMAHSAESVLDTLKSMAAPKNLAGMARFGMATEQRLGISIYDLRRLAKELPHEHTLALELWQSGIAEARILASMLDLPEQVSEQQMEDWIVDFNSWDVCDQVCNNLFYLTPFVEGKIQEWVQREEEFVRRAGYTLIACLAWHDKQMPDAHFIAYFPLLKAHAADSRNYVRKAVNWALRNIGKRNLALNQAAIAFAQELQGMEDKTARWIASNALRELQSDKVQQRVRDRPVTGKK